MPRAGKKPRVQVIWRSVNGGLSAARNSGFEAITGNIYVALDADDTLPATAIADIRRGFLAVPEADFVFGDYLRVDLDSGQENVVDCSCLCGSNGFLDPRNLCEEWLLHGTSPCKKTAWKQIGGYSEAFSNDMQDVDFFMRLFNQGGRGFYLGQKIYHWHRSSSGMNSKVGPDAVRRVTVANFPFYDALGFGMAARQRVLSLSMQVGDFVAARQFARALVKRQCRTPSTVLVASLPPSFSAYLYSFKRKAIQRRKRVQ